MVFLALLTTGLAYLAQSPRWLLRLGLSGYRLDLRVRAFTGYAFACLLLLVGFFLAGVPLGGETAVSVLPSEEPAAIVPTDAADSTEATTDVALPTDLPTVAEASLTDAPAIATATDEPVTGAFIPDPTETPAPQQPVTPTLTVAATAAPTLAATASVTATATVVATATMTPTSTVTPTPTQTPTPIAGETAVVDTGSSTVWVRRTPGGQNLVLVQGGDLVILLNGRASRASISWQEIRTVAGVVGWLETDYLLLGSDG